MGKPINFESRLIFAFINVLVFANLIKKSIYFEQKSYASRILHLNIKDYNPQNPFIELFLMFIWCLIS